MNEEQKNQLEMEVKIGGHAKAAYDNFFKPFVEEKEAVLFEAFKTISVSDTESLMETKRQLLAITALDQDIVSKIETGNMAAKTLAELSGENNE